MADRIQKLIVAFGKKGVGKTYTTNQQIASYVQGNPSKGVPGRRVLILDVNNEFEHIKSMPLKYVTAFSAHPIIEARRIIPFKENGKKMTLDEVTATLFEIVENFKNGLLIIEDINKYISDNMPNDLIGAICTNRHSDLDIILHYQSVARIQTKVWQNLNVIRFHKITDNVFRNEGKFSDYSECLMLAENIVNEVYKVNPRYYLYVDVDEKKIKGNITIQMRDAAIRKYLYDFYKKLVKAKVGRINPDNPKETVTEVRALEIETERLKTEYF